MRPRPVKCGKVENITGQKNREGKTDWEKED